VSPGSVESGTLLLLKSIVPPLWLEGLTTALIAALYRAALYGLGMVSGALPQAERPTAAAAPIAHSANPLRLFIE
jgi:hypothetical protein